jgi:hypothetical protein
MIYQNVKNFKRVWTTCLAGAGWDLARKANEPGFLEKAIYGLAEVQ